MVLQSAYTLFSRYHHTFVSIIWRWWFKSLVGITVALAITQICRLTPSDISIHINICIHSSCCSTFGKQTDLHSRPHISVCITIKLAVTKWPALWKYRRSSRQIHKTSSQCNKSLWSTVRVNENSVTGAKYRTDVFNRQERKRQWIDKQWPQFIVIEGVGQNCH